MVGGGNLVTVVLLEIHEANQRDGIKRRSGTSHPALSVIPVRPGDRRLERSTFERNRTLRWPRTPSAQLAEYIGTIKVPEIRTRSTLTKSYRIAARGPALRRPFSQNGKPTEGNRLTHRGQRADRGRCKTVKAALISHIASLRVFNATIFTAAARRFLWPAVTGTWLCVSGFAFALTAFAIVLADRKNRCEIGGSEQHRRVRLDQPCCH